MNTRFTYEYVAGGKTQRITHVLGGTLIGERIRRIRGVCRNQREFIPTQVGLPHPVATPEAADSVFCQIPDDINPFEPTEQPAGSATTMAELYTRFDNVDEWDIQAALQQWPTTAATKERKQVEKRQAKSAAKAMKADLPMYHKYLPEGSPQKYLVINSGMTADEREYSEGFHMELATFNGPPELAMEHFARQFIKDHDWDDPQEYPDERRDMPSSFVVIPLEQAYAWNIDLLWREFREKNKQRATAKAEQDEREQYEKLRKKFEKK